MRQLWEQDRLKAWGRTLGLLAFAGYVFWNGYWLASGLLPPSIWVVATGLPCPTSGMTRSVGALAAGDWAGFFSYNYFTIPFVLLLLYSVHALARKWSARENLALPTVTGWLWCVTLLGAWCAKFLVGRAYW